MSGRKASINIIPGLTALSVGMPDKEPPKGWKWYPLNEVATMATGHTPSRKYPEYWGGDIPWISVADARPNHGKTIQTTKEYTNELGIKKSAAVLLPVGTVCLSRTGSIGYSIILGKQMATSQGFVNWICSDKLLPRFLQLLFITENSFLHSISEGVAHTTIYFPEAKAFHVCIPCIDEQQHIVSKIEELFSELNKGIEELKTAQQQLKVYRQAVLKWAFEGKLTNEDVKDGKLPIEWKYEQLGEMIEQPKYGTSKKCDYKAVGKGVLRIPNIKAGTVDDSDLKYAEFDQQEIEAYCLKEGDLLTIRSNGSVDIVGQCALITKKSTDYLYAGYLIRLRPLQNIINPSYLLYVFSSSFLRNQIEVKAKSTSGVNNINSNELKSLRVPLCSLEEQQQIVQEIESRLSVCDKIEEIINNSLKQAEAFRQSILKKAFEGKL